MRDRILTLLAILLVLFFAIQAIAQEPTGLEIVTEAKARDAGWHDYSAEAQMQLIAKNGKTTAEREFTAELFEVQDGGDFSKTIVETPKDVKGTVLLIQVLPGEEDNIVRVFFPDSNRNRRVSGSVRRSPFMGSVFTNEDFTPLEIEDFTYTRLLDAMANELDCFVVEAQPVDVSTGYDRLIVYFDKEEYRIQRIEFFDRRRKSHTKTLTIGGYTLYEEKFWRPRVSVMEDLKSGKSAVVNWSDYSFNTGLTQADFSQSGMQR